MGNFQKVNLMTSTSKLNLGESEIELVITGSKTPSYVVFNKVILDAVSKKGFNKLNIYQDAENKVLAFSFAKSGDILVTKTVGDGKPKNMRIANKQLVKFMCEFFGINEAIKQHNKLYISGNKANGSELLMYYVRNTGLDKVNFR